ncbi:hypothetical protein ACQ4PT_019016 [Festuca glaucescens]
MCVSVRNTAILMLLSSFSFAGPGFESFLIKMVKIEDFDEDGAVSARAGVLRNAGVDPQPDPTHASVKLEEGQPSSSSNNLRSQFIGMGFSPMMVDKMIQKHGDHDSNTILESLLSHSASQNSGSESSSSLGSLFASDNEETVSPLVSRREANQDIKPEPDSFSERSSYLLSTMNFSQEEVDMAFNQLGEEVPLDQLVDFIVTAQGAGFSGGKENGHATNEEMVESLYGEMDKIVSLLRMGFTEEEVSFAIDNFGQEAPVQELADSIFARRIASTIEQKQVKTEPEFLGETETEYSTSHQRLSYYDDDDDKKRVKKAKHVLGDDRGASTSRVVRQPSLTPWSSDRFGSYGDGSMKEEVHEVASASRANIRGDLAKPPYFLYGNVIDITKDTWHKLSGFLLCVHPEIVNTQLFSALSRKEGYIHNLPTERRRVLKSPGTIEEALSFTRKFWPSWDKRKKIYGVNLELAGIEKICGELERMIRDSRGNLSEEKQARIIHQCKMANLIWTGQDRLSPLQPDQLERILGYPSNHTSLPNLNPQDRIAAMTYAFQTDTIAHLLSVLKNMYPDGLRVLSIYSGVGGAEVALHRLGIRLKCVVSVEESDVNRKILKRWWGRTEQAGELKQLDSIKKLKIDLLEELMDKFGGFDFVVGGTYSSCRGGTTVSATMGMDSGQFFEYVRVVQRVRSMHGLN